MNFIKSKKIILLTIISLSAAIFIIININKNKDTTNSVTPTPISNKQTASYKNITAGEQFNENKINELIGYPVNSTISGEIKTNNYRSSNEYRNNELKIKKGKVNFIREVVNPDDNKKADDIRNIYGIADYVLYEKESNSFFNLYVYLKNGIAYLGHEDGTILEIWYFEPTTLENFIENYASNYQETLFEGQSTY
ncbi:MAG: hypothetical protein AAB778_03315 [Patescibacteria group bacterium]